MMSIVYVFGGVGLKIRWQQGLFFIGLFDIGEIPNVSKMFGCLIEIRSISTNSDKTWIPSLKKVSLDGIWFKGY